MKFVKIINWSLPNKALKINYNFKIHSHYHDLLLSQVIIFGQQPIQLIFSFTFMDSSLFTSSTSSSSSSSSRKGSAEAWNFDFSHEKRPKRAIRSSSLKAVTEEQEEFMSPRFHRINLPKDELEIRIPHRMRPRQPRRAQWSPHNASDLPLVEEVRGDDDELQRRRLFNVGMMLDKDEFNDKKQRPYPPQRLTLDAQAPIIEDAQENDRERVQHMSPKYKLKVDEVDFDVKRSVESVIEVIEEEKPEVENNAKEKEMFQKIKKILVEERDFLKKIVKGEQMQEEDLIKKEQIYSYFGEHHWNSLIQVAEENVSGSSDEEKLPQ